MKQDTFIMAVLKRGVDCKYGYTEERELLKQFNELIEKIKYDVERFSKLQKFLLGTKEKIDIPNIDIRGYAKFVLKEGTDIEKRELLANLRSRIIYKDKELALITE